MELTWYDITRIHGVLVLDESKAVHQLDLHDLTRAMGVEVVLDIGLGSCDLVQSAISRSGQQSTARTVAVQCDRKAKNARQLLVPSPDKRLNWRRYIIEREAATAGSSHDSASPPSYC